MSKFVPTPHPILPVPSAKVAAEIGEAKWVELLAERERLIVLEKQDPFRHGWEPPAWALPDALLDYPWTDKDRNRAWREAMGFQKPVKVVLIMGGNRSSKTRYAGKRTSQQLVFVPESISWVFHATVEMSRSTHHRIMFDYIPPEWRALNFQRTAVTYIAWKQKTGFSENKYVLPNASECGFKVYAMEMDDALQGPEINSFWGDELIPPDWMDELEMRVATRDGWGLASFTPVQGYTATVAKFLDGAESVMDAVAFLCPKDGKPPLYYAALGFESEEAMAVAHAQERWSLPSTFEIRDGRLVERQPAVPEGRTFERVPRVMRCVNPNYAVVFFHSTDNPFGNPKTVLSKLKTREAAYIKERFYGIAHKTVSCRFPKFDRKVHVVPAKSIPAQGTNYLLGDPATGRNFLWKWYRVCPDGSKYLYREWPGNYWIPGVGVPGPWALPDGKHPDGKPGPAQVSFGFGLLRYKQELARLEGWTDARRGMSKEQEKELVKKGAQIVDRERDGVGQHFATLAERQVKQWTEEHGVRERIFRRFLDSRAASSPRVENDRPKTLLTDFEDIGLIFELTPGDDIAEGVAAINDALDWDEAAPLDFFNHPKFYVSEECANSIFALQIWTGADGQKGATKDLVDLDRYFLMLDLDYVDETNYWITQGVGHW